MNVLSKALIEKEKTCKPIWFMRQAGRYLPEFRKIRKKNQNFINLCLDSNLSSEITLQPIKRYNLDAAIIFSDILLVPYALGQKVNFIEGKGPTLSNFSFEKFKSIRKSNFLDTLSPVYEAISKTRKKLDKDKSLISFVGAPWTLLIYMLNLKKNKEEIRLSKLENLDINIMELFTKLNEYLCLHIKSQISAGADVVQIFDSWAGLLPKADLKNFCHIPNLKLVEFCKKEKTPVICFPKGLKEDYLAFNKIVKPDGLNLDSLINPRWAKSKLSNVVLQGGMNPLILLESNEKILAEAKKYLDIFKDVPYIFNLGHGLVPETDPDKLKSLIEYVRNFRK